jgi:hypothetical protein
MGDDAVRRRAMALTLAVHAMLGVALFYGRSVVAAAPPTRALSVIALAGPAAAAPKPPQPRPVPPTPPQPVVIPPPIVPQLSDTSAAMPDFAAAQFAGGACDLTLPIQAMLQNDPTVQAALPNIPRDERSVANVINVWTVNADEAAPAIDPALLATLRSAIGTAVAAAPEECRTQPQAGPSLMVARLDDQTIVSVGSGQWTWQALVDGVEQSQAVPNEDFFGALASR